MHLCCVLWRISMKNNGLLNNYKCIVVCSNSLGLSTIWRFQCIVSFFELQLQIDQLWDSWTARLHVERWTWTTDLQIVHCCWMLLSMVVGDKKMWLCDFINHVGAERRIKSLQRRHHHICVFYSHHINHKHFFLLYLSNMTNCYMITWFRMGFDPKPHEFMQ